RARGTPAARRNARRARAGRDGRWPERPPPRGRGVGYRKGEEERRSLLSLDDVESKRGFDQIAHGSGREGRGRAREGLDPGSDRHPQATAIPPRRGIVRRLGGQGSEIRAVPQSLEELASPLARFLPRSSRPAPGRPRITHQDVGNVAEVLTGT